MSWLDRVTGAFTPTPRPQPQQAPLAALAPPPVQRATSFSPIPTAGPTLSQYPTREDAIAARGGGFGYGEPTSAYIEGTAGRIFGTPKGALPMEGRRPVSEASLHGPEFWDIANRAWETPTTQAANPQQRALTQDAMTRAALAANYSPLAALGFDPRAVTADVSGKSRLRTLAGMTNPDTGEMVYNAGVSDPSTIIHESMHRALMMLKDDKRLPVKLQVRLQNPDHEESTVRQFVKAQTGNPEKDEVATGQQGQGPQWTPEEMQIVNKLAQEKIAKNRPRGPR